MNTNDAIEVNSVTRRFGDLVAVDDLSFQVALAFGLMARNYMADAIGSVLGAMMILFIRGGLGLTRMLLPGLPGFSPILMLWIPSAI